MAWYVDSSLILNMENLIEAHCLNGAADYDGWYLLVCHIKHYEILKEISTMYKSREDRDAAFAALGQLLKGK